jgi:hypothetical protein
MTELRRSVRLRNRSTLAHHRKRIVISLGPGDTLAMRLKRIRTMYPAILRAVFRQLAAWHASAEQRRKKKKGISDQ